MALTDEKMAACEILADIWGETEGYVFLPHIPAAKARTAQRKESWSEGPAFAWPKDRARIKAHLKKHWDDELYFSVAVFSEPSRRAEFVATVNLLFADLDGVDPNRIEDSYKPTHAWETSPSRYAAAWKMAGSLDNPYAPGGMNHRLTRYLGADPSGWDTTQVLRVPGSANNKKEYPRGTRGRIVWSEPEVDFSLNWFNALPEIEANQIQAAKLTESEVNAIDWQAVWKRVRSKVNAEVRRYMNMPETEGLDRSDISWQIDRELADAGCSVVEIVAVTKNSIWNKFEGRQDEMKRLHTQAAKAIAQVESNQPVRGKADGIGDEAPRPRRYKADELVGSRPKVWLARQRIPRSAITILVGDEGIGKSLFWVWVVAAVTTGKAVPEFGIPEREPLHVVLVVTEDDWSEEVRPRLELVEADLSMITVICAEKDGSGSPVFPGDDMALMYEDPKPALIVVDAWVDTVPSNLNVQTPQQARIALHPWKEVATHTGAAVMLLAHTNRQDSGSARSKYGVTGELRKKARMTLFAQEGEPGHLLVGPEKSNGSAIVAATKFERVVVQVHESTPDDEGTMAKLVCKGDSDRTAREHVEQVSREEEWLLVFLSEGPKDGTEVIEKGLAEGFKEYKLRKAARELKVKYTKGGFQGASQWELP